MLKFALRVLWKNRLFSFLNIFGLTLGLSAVIWLVLFLQNELTYDQHHPNHERVYRVSHLFQAPGVEFNTAYTASELNPMLKEEFPEIDGYARFRPLDASQIEYNQQIFIQDHVYYSEQGAFDIFGINLLSGNPESALIAPNSAIISRTLKEKLFGNDTGLNKVIKVEGNDFKVTAVFEDIPKNSHFKFEILLSGVDGREWATQDGVFNSEVLWNSDCAGYIRLSPGATKEGLLAKFGPFNEKYFMPFGNQIEGSHRIRLQRLSEIHYDAEQIDDDFAKGNPTNLIIFSSVGLAILLLACINYINLSTAGAGARAKEIAIRKVLGTNIQQLKVSLLIESLVQVYLAYGLSILMVWLMIEQTPLQTWLGVSFDFTLLQNIELILASFAVASATGLISGLYPALYLSKIQTVTALKGNWVANKSGKAIRQGLVLFQFVISIGVLLSTLLMRDQIEFLQKKDMGFSKDQVLLINTADSISQSRTQVLKNVLEASSSIEKVTSSNFIAGTNVGQIVFTVDKDGEMVQQEFKFIHGDEDYLETFEIPLAAGRTYSGEETRGNQYFVINEKAAENLGWDDPIGKKLGFFHQEVPGQVIGVMRDFNFFSLHNPIEPLVFVYNPQPGRNLIVKFNQDQLSEALEVIKAKWDEVLPNYPLEYSFLNDQLKAQYEADQTQNKLISSMTLLCILISLIGLTGLTSFNIGQRRKEIGIRKVLGAMSGQIVFFMYSGTLKLIALAGVIATPLAYLAISNWMLNFEYQAAINITLIVVGLFAALLLTFLLVGSLVVKTARKNPVDSLRYE
ncbi:ABC transporter permease [Roseivirga sp. E12]|uniref:ABC transporter permease n=1 Tax=Roseivirga sp. E12 TaxID=2819237 RepID=UPI001ABC2DC7|nr:ABC transporter permease [Roseivirga sp. E12]MBO3699781.1 ABC transporter permease [Roseivirga sp. E12]